MHQREDQGLFITIKMAADGVVDSVEHHCHAGLAELFAVHRIALG